MEKAVIDQLLCALSSLAAGAAFGVLYDLLKALRLKIKSLIFTAACDIAVCLTAFAGLFLLFMTIGGGEARLYIALCFALGALVYFLLASPAFLGFFTQILELIAKILHFIARPAKILAEKLKITAKKVKMFFQNSCKRFTIKAKAAPKKRRKPP